MNVVTSTDAGATWGTPRAVSDVGEDAYKPQLVTDGNSITVAWEGQLSSGYFIRTSTTADDGVTWSAPTSVSEPVGPASEVQLVTDGDTVTAVWHENDGGELRVHASSSADGGATWTSPVMVSAPSSYTAYPSVATDGSTITVAWEYDDGDDWQIQTASSTDGGTTWSAAETLSVAGVNSLSPRLAAGANTVTATWYRAAGGDSEVQVSSITRASAPDPDPDPGTGDDGDGTGLAATGPDDSVAVIGLAAIALLAGGIMLGAGRRHKAAATR